MTERRTKVGKIVISENVTLDGVIEDPAGVESFRRGGWIGRIGDRGREEAAKVALNEAQGAEAMLLGRRSYEFLAARWPSREGELADRLNSLPKYVVSSTLEDPAWNNTAVLNGEVVDEVSKLKQELNGEIVVAASIQLVRTLTEHDLVDELRLMVYPVRARRRRAPLRRDQRQEAHAPPGHPDGRWRPRLPDLRGRPGGLSGERSANGRGLRPARPLRRASGRDCGSTSGLGAHRRRALAWALCTSYRLDFGTGRRRTRTGRRGRGGRRKCRRTRSTTGPVSILFDPLAVPIGILDLAADREPVVVLTAPWHERDTQRLVERLGVPVFVPPPDTADDLVRKYGITPEQAAGGSPDVAWLLAGEGGEGHLYSAGERLPLGIEAFPGREQNDLVLWIDRVGSGDLGRHARRLRTRPGDQRLAAGGRDARRGRRSDCGLCSNGRSRSCSRRTERRQTVLRSSARSADG